MAENANIDIACYGAALIDIIAHSHGPLMPETSNPGTVSTGVGGVAFNVACNLSALGSNTALVTALGDDVEGRYLRDSMNHHGVDTSFLPPPDGRSTGRYVAVENAYGELSVAISDTTALEQLTARELRPPMQALAQAGLWFVDANLLSEVILAIAVNKPRPPLAVDAVSVAKAVRLKASLKAADYLFCNLSEAGAILDKKFRQAAEAVELFAEAGVAHAVVTDGPRPVAVSDGAEVHEIKVPAVEVHSVNGAGDSLIAATLNRIQAGDPLAAAVERGIETARRTINSNSPFVA